MIISLFISIILTVYALGRIDHANIFVRKKRENI